MRRCCCPKITHCPQKRPRRSSGGACKRFLVHQWEGLNISSNTSGALSAALVWTVAEHMIMKEDDIRLAMRAHFTCALHYKPYHGFLTMKKVRLCAGSDYNPP